MKGGSNRLEITIQNSAMDFWAVTFSNWIQEVIVRNFVGTRFQIDPDAVILQKY